MDLYLALNAEIPNAELSKDFNGVGMIRSEYLCRNIKQYVTLETCQKYIKEYLEQICTRFENKEIWYRLTDLTSNEIDVLDGCDYNIVEKFHFIGIKGARRYIKFIDTFLIEVDIINQIRKKYKNVGLIIPFIKDIQEYKQIKEIIKNTGYDGKIGIMAEIPSVIFDIDSFIKEGVDNITIGLNDLTSLTLGTYRESEYHDKIHPTILKIVKKVNEKCKKKNIIFSIAGYFSKKEINEYEKQGISRITVNYANLPNLNKKYETLENLDMLKRIKEDTKNSRKIHNL